MATFTSLLKCKRNFEKIGLFYGESRIEKRKLRMNFLGFSCLEKLTQSI